LNSLFGEPKFTKIPSFQEFSMLKKTVFLALITLMAVSFATAKTYTVKLNQPSIVEGKELKPGNYKVELTGDKVKLTSGNETVETAAKSEEGTERFAFTSVRYVDENGKMKISEIRLGGTSTKLVFN
jgi:hypothetical protein